MKKQAFTLAETLIVLVVIGILAAILLPVARNIAPDRNLMKFKKAHTTLGNVIRELVQSEQYYKEGDLGVKPDGSWVEETDYFLLTISEILNTKKLQLPERKTGKYATADIIDGSLIGHGVELSALDTQCKTKQNNFKSFILANDNTYYYQYNDEIVYGSTFSWISSEQKNPFYALWNRKVPYSYCTSFPTKAEQDQCAIENFKSGFYFVYSIFCIDIDDIGKGEDPFGYGIRVDGKIMTGKRAQEWLEREK
ncbi:MAG: type II secretion system protein [Candidatus Gastranaerophilales bacterium]|nr:type II secretion system protein [Candidatus Gastranaerophilales bacterium]